MGLGFKIVTAPIAGTALYKDPSEGGIIKCCCSHRQADIWQENYSIGQENASELSIVEAHIFIVILNP